MEIALKKFYNLFWNNITCRNIFLLHKEILLEKNSIDLKITDYYLPRIVISNSRKQKKSELKISSRSENIFIELLHKLSISEEKYFSQERMQKYLDKRYGETQSLIQKEHQELGMLGFFIEFLESFSEEDDIIELLRKYKIIPQEISNLQSLGRYLEEELLREVAKFFRTEEVSDILESIDDISDVYNSILKESLIKANKQVTDKLFDHEDFTNRLEVFESLYEIGVLSGGYFKSYLECTYCLPKTFSGFFNCDLPPSKLKFKCPSCGKEVYYMVPYQIDRGLYEHIIDKDGVLANAISYLLDQHKIRYDRNVNLEEANEVDFVTKEMGRITGLIEVKMFRNDKSTDVKVKNLLEAISQVKKTKEKLVKKNKIYDKIQYIVVSNLVDEEVYEIAREKGERDLEKYNILILRPKEFSESL